MSVDRKDPRYWRFVGGLVAMAGVVSFLMYKAYPLVGWINEMIDEVVKYIRMTG